MKSYSAAAVGILGITSLLMLDACTPKPVNSEPPVQRERQAFLERSAAAPVDCSVGQDCVEKWARVQQWISRHSSYSMRPVTDTEITTLGPIDPTTDSAFIVTKTPLDAGSARINFSSSCGKAPVCVPSSLELKASFNQFVMTGQE